MLAALTFITACQTQAPEEGGSATTTAAPIVTLNGSGASFPLFFYQRIFDEYRAIAPNVQVNYQPIGSAAGIQQMIAETVDFGGSDIAMTDAEIAEVERGVVLVPLTAGMVAIAYNLPGLDQPLQLSRSVYSDIFLGKITQWNDPAIAATNPDLTLPDLPIILVHRSDGSGTNAIFTAHLSAISSEWADAVGTGLNVQWPAGVGVKANAGVGAQILQAEGAIGYVEYSYAQKLGLSLAALENQSGEFVAPSLEAGAAGLQEAEFGDRLRAFVTDPAAADAYPLVTYSWLLVYQDYEDAAKAEAMQALLRWSLTEGQQFSTDLGYIPLPAPAVAAATDAIAAMGES
ncbi:MAG: phosphate ABC transporter substrate-binding protein PstS [Spirulinaceae cyanobacterium SM2_1_0]|nr:phosphate ABC transporter substrate-binding protein PstS [Spirulinaceae cyanobacterium SM2_1_0]